MNKIMSEENELEAFKTNEKCQVVVYEENNTKKSKWFVWFSVITGEHLYFKILVTDLPFSFIF